MSPSIIIRDETLRQRAIERVQMLNLDVADPWGVYIAPWKKLRTLEQNALYWRLIGLICAATGHSKIAMHIYFKQLVFGVKVETVNGKQIEVPVESSKAARGDFSELIDTVSEFVAKHGIREAA